MTTNRTNLILLTIVCLVQLGCNESPSSSATAEGNQDALSDLATARNGFVTKLKRNGPAPQSYERSTPPSGVEEVTYSSGSLSLKAWVSAQPSEAKKRPAVVYLHGGWAFGAADWADAAPFVEAGYVVMMPMLRGENGNPGIYEGFYSEVDDAVAAGRFVATLPYVDSENVFLAGHSVGAMLTVLTSMVPSNYKAGAALSGYLDMKQWAGQDDPARVIFDHENPEEVRLRNPMAFPGSLKIPLILYAERGGMDEINARFQKQAERAGRDCELVVTEGDHMTMVEPAVKHAIIWYQKHSSGTELPLSR